MSDIAHRAGYGASGTALATPGSSYDAFSALGAQLQEGTFLAFSKGEYIFGADKQELRLGTQLVANMPGLRQGWRCWVGGKMIDDRSQLLSSGIPAARRSDLGDLDEGLWERDDHGEPRDPWVFTFMLELADPDSGTQYLFSTSSTGGEKAIKRLSGAFGKEGRMRPGMLPIIELQRDSYVHSNKAYGKIYVPMLPIVGWVNAESDSSGAHEAGEDKDDDQERIPF